MKKNNFIYISTILEKGSFTEAAKALFISQPSLSQYIKRIEDEIGAELFFRNTKPIQLTDAGFIYLEAQKNINNIRSQAINQISELNELKSGSITIGSSNYRSIFLLSKTIPTYLEKYPNIEIRLEEGRTDYLQDCAINGVTDFSIALTPPKSDVLNFEFLFQEKIIIALKKNHKISKFYNLKFPQKKPYPLLDFSELKDEPFIIIKPGQYIRKSFFELCNKTNVEPNIVMETEDMLTAKTLAATGIGVTIIPEPLSKSNLYFAEPAYFNIKQKIKKREVIAVYNKSRPLSKAALTFLQLLKKDTSNSELDLTNY